jgi:hypothetical protein
VKGHYSRGDVVRSVGALGTGVVEHDDPKRTQVLVKFEGVVHPVLVQRDAIRSVRPGRGVGPEVPVDQDRVDS